MKEQSLSRFEAQLERLIEGAFAQIFSKTVRAQDIALQLARAMEQEARPSDNGDPRPLAPDSYTIRLNPNVCGKLLLRQPALAQILSKHMVELATDGGFVLNTIPEIEIAEDGALSTGELVVQAEHSNRTEHVTEVMRRVEEPHPGRGQRPKNAQLIINGQTIVPLEEPIINIGRGRDNHIVLDDPYVSRHHAQMRLRFGRYTLFDVQSQTGTFINDVRVREHQLQTGDVLRLGKMQLVYVEDDPLLDSQTHQNLSLDD